VLYSGSVIPALTELISKFTLARVTPTCRGESMPAAKVDFSIVLPNIRGIFLDKIAVLDYGKRACAAV
jgi:hypothetical protein